MPRPRRPFSYGGIAILCVLFSLFGVLLIVAGRGAGGRLIGVMILLVFGCGGYARISGPALTRHGAVTVRRDRVETSVGSEPAFVFPSPRAKRRATAIGLGGIAVGTVGMLAITGGSAFLVAGTASLCLVAIWSLIAVRRRQLLALTPTRVVVETPAGTVEVPWTAGVDAEIYPMPTGQATVDMVGLVATDAGAATWSRGRAIGLVNSRLSNYVVSIAADSFAGEGEDVVAAIRRDATDSAARCWIGGEEEHGRLLQALAETDPHPGVAGLPAG
jgi:hypothetical protein